MTTPPLSSSPSDSPAPDLDEIAALLDGFHDRFCIIGNVTAAQFKAAIALARRAREVETRHVEAVAREERTIAAHWQWLRDALEGDAYDSIRGKIFGYVHIIRANEFRRGRIMQEQLDRAREVSP